MNTTLFRAAQLLLLTALFCSTTKAVEATGNVTLTTDYIFRGVSQTKEKGAVQGGFDLAFDNGFYTGLWASSISIDAYLDANMELDIFAGYTHEFNENMSLDVNVYHFQYDGATIGNYQEFGTSVSLYDFTLGLVYSNEYFGQGGDIDGDGDGDKFLYTYISYAHALPADFAVEFHVGLNQYDEESLFEPLEDDYVDWSLSVVKSLSGFDFALTYHDTTIDDLFGVDAEDADGRVVFSISKSL